MLNFQGTCGETERTETDRVLQAVGHIGVDAGQGRGNTTDDVRQRLEISDHHIGEYFVHVARHARTHRARGDPKHYVVFC